MDRPVAQILVVVTARAVRIGSAERARVSRQRVVSRELAGPKVPPNQRESERETGFIFQCRDGTPAATQATLLTHPGRRRRVFALPKYIYPWSTIMVRSG